MKVFLIFSLVVLCSACSTVKTINPAGDQVDIRYNGNKSYCESIPRIYSGLSYNFCLMHSKPSPSANVGFTINGLSYVGVDSFFSVVTDTVVLPYTIYTQVEKGSLEVN